jgi:hypothetical protein
MVFMSHANRQALVTGLPDEIFCNQKSQFGQILQGLVLESVGIFLVDLVYFTAASWYI